MVLPRWLEKGKTLHPLHSRYPGYPKQQNSSSEQDSPTPSLTFSASRAKSFVLPSDPKNLKSCCSQYKLQTPRISLEHTWKIRNCKLPQIFTQYPNWNWCYCQKPVSGCFGKEESAIGMWRVCVCLYVFVFHISLFINYFFSGLESPHLNSASLAISAFLRSMVPGLGGAGGGIASGGATALGAEEGGDGWVAGGDIESGWVPSGLGWASLGYLVRNEFHSSGDIPSKHSWMSLSAVCSGSVVVTEEVSPISTSISWCSPHHHHPKRIHSHRQQRQQGNQFLSRCNQ